MTYSVSRASGHNCPGAFYVRGEIMKKRIFSLFMVFSLCFVNVNQVYADAASLTIAGGSIGVAGLTGASLAGLAVPALAVIGAVMIGAGLEIELSEQAESRGMTKTEFIKDCVTRFCNATQQTAGDFYKAVLTGVNVTKTGAIELSNQSIAQIKQLAEWMQSNLSMRQSVQASSTDTVVSIENYQFPVRSFYTSPSFQRPDGITMILEITTSVPVIYIGVSSSSLVLTNKGSSFQMTIRRCMNGEWENYWSGNVYSSQVVNTDRIFYGNNQTGIYGYSLELMQVPNLNMTVDEAITYVYSHDTTVSEPADQVPDIADGWDGVIYGTSEVLQSLSDLLTDVPNKTTVVNPNITIDGINDLNDKVMDVQEYLESISAALDGVQDNVITLTDVVTGLVEDVHVGELDDDPVIEKEEDTNLDPDEDKDPVINDTKVPDGKITVDPMKFDLKGIFPFCIPWDVKDMLSKLSAAPVAPVYTVNWLVPIVNERLVFTVDLSPFNGVAEVCRNMELLAFCIGLAVVTRQLFLRG